ncbi:hypothetical protein [Nocardioides alkalitolerans]|uniref:hypothetical protein n=1 Tax=Nocardioides alkalitolerans TaxID=281714 RepID=UPI000410FBC7|nr:hypothetical protein [Nocardioides alkalitolerans]
MTHAFNISAVLALGAGLAGVLWRLLVAERIRDARTHRLELAGRHRAARLRTHAGLASATTVTLAAATGTIYLSSTTTGALAVLLTGTAILGSASLVARLHGPLIGRDQDPAARGRLGE